MLKYGQCSTSCLGWCSRQPTSSVLRRNRHPNQRLGPVRAGNQQNQNSKPQQHGEHSPLDVLLDDLRYVHEHTGLDLLTPLLPVRDAHEQVVAALNPLAGREIQRSLEEQVAGLQHELAEAHQEAHAMEERLESSVADLNSLEAAVGTFPALVEERSSSTDHEQRQQRAASSSAASSAASEQSSQASTSSAGVAQHSGSSRQAGQRGSKLHSSLEVPDGLRDFWYPAEFSSRLAKDTLVPIELFGQPWVLFRDEQGKAACLRDVCAHRACPLSLGSISDGQVACAYHGWQFNAAGACTKMPSTQFCRGISVTSLPVVESDGCIWVWPGAAPPADPSPSSAHDSQHSSTGLASASTTSQSLSSSSSRDSAAADSSTAQYPGLPPLPSIAQPPAGFTVHTELMLEVPVEHGLLLENLLDLAHAPFTHTTTFAKGWPVPDVVKFHTARMLGGNWEPYPIDMSFEPPCVVLSTIGLAQPGKIERGARAESCKNHLHQMHACLPAGPGKTRLLYRMSLDFLGWAQYVPGIQAFWAYIANQVLGEDLVLVAGQQDRMTRGADVWKHPVSYDKLGARYRRWRNSVAQRDTAQQQEIEAAMKPITAGELFSPELP